MLFKLVRHGWFIGDKLIPEGQVIDTSASDDWARLASGHMPPPLNAQALDQATYNSMVAAYPNHRHLILSAPGVVR